MSDDWLAEQFTLPSCPGAYEEFVDELAERAVGMALDNGADMLGVDPDDHLRKHHAGYVAHATEELFEESGLFEMAENNRLQRIVTLAGLHAIEDDVIERVRDGLPEAGGRD